MEDSVCCIAFIHIRTCALTLPLPFSSLDGEAIKDSGSAHCVCGYQFGYLSSHLKMFIETIRNKVALSNFDPMESVQHSTGLNGSL